MGADALPSVLHVSTPLTWRGGEAQVTLLAAALAAGGARQAVLCSAGSAIERACAERGIEAIPLARRSGVDPWFARGLARAARGFDLVHAHDAHAHVAAVLAASLFGLRVPVVLHRRVRFPLRAGALSRWKWRHPSIRRVVCVSRAVAESAASSVRDPAILRVVHDGVDLDRYPGVRAGALRRELGIPAGATDVKLVAQVAALAHDKDPLGFVEAAARVRAPGARFALVGEGRLRAEAEARVRALGLDGRLALTGFRGDVPAILPDLDALVVARDEGLGSVVLEAFASGVPVVATRAGGVPELVVHEETGLLAEPGDPAGIAAAVDRLLADAALRARVVASGRAAARARSAPALAAATLAIYRELLA